MNDQYSREVQADVHIRDERRSFGEEGGGGVVGLEHGRTESVCQPPPDEDLPSAANCGEEIVFGEDKEFLNFPSITEEEVRNALAKEVKKHKSWRMQAVKRMRILNIETSMALRYTLDSFTETRTTFEVTEPYTGQPLDGFASFSGGGDNVWEVPCEPSQPFVEDVRQFELPGSSNITNCAPCSGQGSSHCFHCRGFGTGRCNLCNGTGMKSGVPHPAVITHPMVGAYNQGSTNPSIARSTGGNQYALGTPVHFHSMAGLPPPGLTTMDLCIMCQGRGVKECYHCKGQGKKPCGACGGSGRCRSLVKMKVKFAVQSNEYIHEMGIPEKVMKVVSGEIVFAEMKPHLVPVRNFPIEAINDQSRRLIQVHLNNNVGRSKILQQRHMLEAVPVAEVTFELSGRHGRFWVVGLERVAYIPQYPQKCSIL